MKHKLTVLFCVAVIILSGSLAVRSYEQHQTWQNSVNDRAATAKAIEAKKQAELQAAYNAKVKQLEEQCAKDQTNYSALTSLQKARTSAPNCSLNLVQ